MSFSTWPATLKHSRSTALELMAVGRDFGVDPLGRQEDDDAGGGAALAEVGDQGDRVRVVRLVEVRADAFWKAVDSRPGVIEVRPTRAGGP